MRGDARAALVAYGPEGLAFLDEALGDASLPVELRRHLPRTVALFDPQPAAEVLQRRIIEERVGAIRYRMLRGLNRLAAAAGVELDPELLATATRDGRGCLPRCTGGASLKPAPHGPASARPGHGLLVQLLRDKEAQAIERLLRLLALQYRGEDFRDIHRGLRSRDPRARSSSRELLENLLRPPLREPILAVVGEASDAERLAGAGGLRVAGRSGEPSSSGCHEARAPWSPCTSATRAQSPRPRLVGSRAGRRASSCRACSSARSRRSATSRRTCVPDVARMVPPLERLLHLKRIPLLSGLPTPEVAALADVAQERFYRKGEVVFREDVPAGGALFVVEGRLADFRHGIQVGTVGPGQGIGGMSVLARAEYGSQVVADLDTLGSRSTGRDLGRAGGPAADPHHMLRR